MKTINLITLSITLFFGLNLFAQNADQNPNYKESQAKYVEKAETLTATQGTTIQDTYKAYDWTEYKAEKKQDRIDRRNARYNMRYNYSNSYYGNGYGYNNSSNGYYNNTNGYYNNSGYYNSPSYSSNNVYNSILLGAVLYSIFK